MPDKGTQTDKPKRAPNKKNNIIKIKKIKEPKTKEQYIKPNFLLIFDENI